MRPAPTKLIVGLGNPGKEHARNRHNVGFQIVDKLAARYDLEFDKMEFQGLLSAGEMEGLRVLLLKPLTYMNKSGKAVRPVQSKYRISTQDILIIYDDLDLPLGKMRVRERGGSGGHKGMESVIACLGTRSVARIRVGIGRPGSESPEEYVLQDFSLVEAIVVSDVLEKAVEAVVSFLRDGVEQTMSRFN
ncbi:MAG: aminoacyl-tRNA hydrolase [Anaerolineae bacterium]|nr:aminoacyl-tRNA hydrolase [Anaerolineae bacterium]NIN98636.1 aminoacyl-tRNA hydrolase [Anaerolineae bacterium]NIQ81523.1 aminoacyl-tRNA hydrolase [Anaerolineae bacterium]